jgi:uncharacterized membrane protein YoaK (UPF0700 family)
VTVIKIIAVLWTGAPDLIKYVAAHSAFFYGVAAGVAISGTTKKLWLILPVVAAVYLLLSYVGI